MAERNVKGSAGVFILWPGEEHAADERIWQRRNTESRHTMLGLPKLQLL